MEPVNRAFIPTKSCCFLAPNPLPFSLFPPHPSVPFPGGSPCRSLLFSTAWLLRLRQVKQYSPTSGASEPARSAKVQAQEAGLGHSQQFLEMSCPFCVLLI